MTHNLTTSSTDALVAPEFPITWEHPDDAAMTWQFDRMHFPKPITLLDDWLIERLWEGAYRSAQWFGFPMHYACRRINTYAYFAIIPDEGPAEELVRREQQAYVRLNEAITRLEADWNELYLPEIKQHLAAWERVDLAGASDARLVEHLDEMHERQVRMWEIHDLVFIPQNTATSMFHDMYVELFQPAGAFESYRLLQGFGNTTVQAGRRLWELSRQVRETPEVRDVVLGTEPELLMGALEGLTAWEAIAPALRSYLDEFGRRGEMWGVSAPTLVELPTPILRNLQDYVRIADREAVDDLAHLAVAREHALSAARHRLQGYPRAAVDEFETLLAAAQQAVVLSEDHNFWIDGPCIHYARQLFLEIGRRLTAAGALDTVDDVFHLTYAELRASIAMQSRVERRAAIAARKAEMAYFRTVAAPEMIGTPEPAGSADDPVLRGVERFFGVVPEQAAEPGSLRGTAGSPGLARGIARVIRSLADASRLAPGDVLVTESTSPAWTPLFAIAGALVTDTGGVLSHSAVVAREYGLPAVVGTGQATDLLRDGQLVEVDGDAGIVRVVDGGTGDE